MEGSACCSLKKPRTSSTRRSAEADFEGRDERDDELGSVAIAASILRPGARSSPADAEAVGLDSLPAGRNGLAEAIITLDGAGAGLPSRKVASNMASSLPSSGARPTYSTRTRA